MRRGERFRFARCERTHADPQPRTLGSRPRRELGASGWMLPFLVGGVVSGAAVAAMILGTAGVALPLELGLLGWR